MTPGERPRTLRVAGVTFGVAICLESLYPPLVAEEADQTLAARLLGLPPGLPPPAPVLEVLVEDVLEHGWIVAHAPQPVEATLPRGIVPDDLADHHPDLARLFLHEAHSPPGTMAPSTHPPRNVA